jgi:putative addiction module component (TIGR02574 family)
MREVVVSIVEEALTLKPIERLHLVDELLLSLDIPTKEIDLVWAEEAEKRLEAYNLGEVKTLSSQEVFAKYRL